MKIDTVGIPWIGVDLDGTLAHYDGWKGVEHIGEPISAMMIRVKTWLSEGKTVKIFTCRVAHNDEQNARRHVEVWLEKHDLPKLEITSEKDWGMLELWDDRAISVIPNTGERRCNHED